MEKIYNSKIITLFLSIVLGFGGTIIINNPNSLHYLNLISPVELVTEHDAHMGMIGGEHPTDIIVTGDERKVIESGQPIAFHIKNNFSSIALVSYSFILADELGNEIFAEPTSKVDRIDPGDSVKYDLLVPQNLDEGLYSYQVTAVGKTREQFADSGIDLNFAILSGRIYMLNNEEWLKYSLANGANLQ